MDGPPPLWAVALVADPYSLEIVSSRLKDLLDKEVEGVCWLAKGAKRSTILYNIVYCVDWSFKPEAFDAMWHAIFSVAKKLGCTEDIRDATYFWTEQYLLNEAMDAIPGEGDEDYGLTDGYDKTWIATAIGDARLYALGYGYSP